MLKAERSVRVPCASGYGFIEVVVEATTLPGVSWPERAGACGVANTTSSHLRPGEG